MHLLLLKDADKTGGALNVTTIPGISPNDDNIGSKRSGNCTTASPSPCIGKRGSGGEMEGLLSASAPNVALISASPNTPHKPSLVPSAPTNDQCNLLLPPGLLTLSNQRRGTWANSPSINIMMML